jgi:dihydropteroate synthase
VDRGAAVVRVHDVRDTVAALAVWRAMKATESLQQTKEPTT